MCDQSYLVETTQTVMVIGVMVGAMTFSALSDRFGRKPVFLFSEWAMVVVGIITAFVNNYYLFAAMRFLAGALQQVSGICMVKGYIYIMIVEVCIIVCWYEGFIVIMFIFCHYYHMDRFIKQDN